MTDRYTYKLVFTEGGSGITSEVIPDKAPTIEWKKESEDIKYFRRKKMGDFIFSKVYQKEDGSLHSGNGVMFEYIWMLYFDATKQGNQLDITIYDNDRSEYLYIGYFTIKDIKLDLEAQTITIKPEINDDYRWILASEDKEVDIIVENRSSLNGMAIYNAVYTYNTYTQTENGTPPDQPPDFPPSGTWVQIGNPADNRWARQRSVYNIDGWTQYGSYWYYGTEETETVDFIFPNCHRLMSHNDYVFDDGNPYVDGYDARMRGVIQYILDNILPSDHRLQVKSEFFTNEQNYVTGDVNYLMNTLIEQKSDAKDPDATNKALKGITSFKKLMNDLGNMFNVAWFIDDDGYLRIEHIKFFQNGFSSTDGTPSVCVDLSDVLKYKDLYTGEGFFNDTQRYEWSSSERPKAESWKFLEEYTVEHRSDLNYIEYSELISSTNNTKERSISLFTTDLRHIYNSPDEIGDDGFVLFNCKSLTDGVSSSDNEEGVIHDIMKYNGDVEVPIPYYPNIGFGQEHLIPDYWYWDRPYINAMVYLHGGRRSTAAGTDFESAEKQLLQKDIIFLLNTSDTFDIKKYIRSYRYERSLSGTDPNSHFNLVKDEGEIITAKLDLETGYYTVTIAYGIY